MTTPLQLWNDANDLMDVCVASLDSLPVYSAGDPDGELLGAPERRYFSDGVPAYDCPEQLTIHLQNTEESPTTGGSLNPVPSTERIRIGRVNRPTFVVTIIRCRPSSFGEEDPPPVRDLTLAARQHMADLWALWNGIWRKAAGEQLFSKCDGMEIALAVADDPSGLSSGWTLRVTPNRQGYDPIPDYVPVDGEAT